LIYYERLMWVVFFSKKEAVFGRDLMTVAF